MGISLAEHHTPGHFGAARGHRHRAQTGPGPVGGAEKARLRPADEEGTEHETPPRERYAALILEIIEFDGLFFAAVSQLAMGETPTFFTA